MGSSVFKVCAVAALAISLIVVGVSLPGLFSRWWMQVLVMDALVLPLPVLMVVSAFGRGRVRELCEEALIPTILVETAIVLYPTIGWVCASLPALAVLARIAGELVERKALSSGLARRVAFRRALAVYASITLVPFAIVLALFATVGPDAILDNFARFIGLPTG